MIGLRALPELRQRIEAWAKQQDDSPLLSEAIRRLVELGLAGSQAPKKTGRKAAAKASDLAAEQIEQRARKHRLIKGPKEFREMRGDQPKAKK
jgi:hypothetical protein